MKHEGCVNRIRVSGLQFVVLKDLKNLFSFIILFFLLPPTPPSHAKSCEAKIMWYYKLPIQYAITQSNLYIWIKRLKRIILNPETLLANNKGLSS